MHKIKLVPDKPFHNNCDITVYDQTGGADKKRCKITADYAEYDIEQMKKEGMDKDAVMAHYREWIYNIVRVHISDDWECTSGMDEVMGIIDEHIADYF